MPPRPRICARQAETTAEPVFFLGLKRSLPWPGPRIQMRGGQREQLALYLSARRPKLAHSIASSPWSSKRPGSARCCSTRTCRHASRTMRLNDLPTCPRSPVRSAC